MNSAMDNISNIRPRPIILGDARKIVATQKGNVTITAISSNAAKGKTCNTVLLHYLLLVPSLDVNLFRVLHCEKKATKFISIMKVVW